VEKNGEEESHQEPVLRSSAAVSKAVHENPEGDEEHKKNGVREAEVKEEMEMENIAQGLGEVTLRSPAKVDQERARQTGMQVDIPVHSQTVSAHVSTTIQIPSSVENASTVLPASSASEDVEEKKRQTEFMIPLRDSITPVKSTTTTTARKSTYGTERQTPVSFSPSSVAFAALPSRGPSRGKSVGGQKRMTLKASEAPEQVHQPYPQEDVKEDLEDKSRMPAMGIVKSVRLAPVSSARQVDPGPVSAPAATPAQVSRHTSGQDRGQQAGPASQGNNNKKSGPGVRSSWLRQAMANAGGEQGVRKSMAGNALRKKSEFDKDVEEEEEENKEEEEEEEEEEEVVHQAVPLEDEPALKGKTHATSVIAQVSGEVVLTVLDQAHAAESKTSTKSTRDIKLVERQPLKPINLSRQLNQPVLDMPLAVETMPQSKLAKMIADLEEKKAAASLAASASRMTLGGQSLSGQHGILGGGTGWNPLTQPAGLQRMRTDRSVFCLDRTSHRAISMKMWRQTRQTRRTSRKVSARERPLLSSSGLSLRAMSKPRRSKSTCRRLQVKRTRSLSRCTPKPWLRQLKTELSRVSNGRLMWYRRHPRNRFIRISDSFPELLCSSTTRSRVVRTTYSRKDSVARSRTRSTLHLQSQVITRPFLPLSKRINRTLALSSLRHRWSLLPARLDRALSLFIKLVDLLNCKM